MPQVSAAIAPLMERFPNLRLVCIVRHGDASGGNITQEGRQKNAKLARKFIDRMRQYPAASPILQWMCSPIPRAQETCDGMTVTISEAPEIRALTGNPTTPDLDDTPFEYGDPPEEVAVKVWNKVLDALDQQTTVLMIVGHLPHLRHLPFAIAPAIILHEKMPDLPTSALYMIDLVAGTCRSISGHDS